MASCVVFVDGVPSKKDYRHYKIKTVVGSDDYATMAEVLGRRFRRAADEGVFPDLLVVDGGKGQLGVAVEVLRRLGFEDQVVIGLAKPKVERRRRSERSDLRPLSEAPASEFDAVDKILLPGRSEPIRLPDNSPALNLLRHLRDESHRFAIEFHRKLRRKSTLRSKLDGIPGVGASRRKALLTHFGSLKKVTAASVEELAAVQGIGPAVAQRIFEELQEPG